MIRRHVLRNSLLPTIAVIATQMGYLIGGLVVIEKVFNYNGIGQRIYTAATSKDFTMLESGVLVIAIVYLSAMLIADILYSVLNPRIRHAARSELRRSRSPSSAPTRVRPHARRETLRLLLRSKTFVVGSIIFWWWVFCAFFGYTIAPHDPTGITPSTLASPSWHHLFGTDQLGQDVFSRVLAGARSILTIAPLATALAIVAGTSLGLITGYMRGAVDDIVSRLIEALLAIPLIVLAITIVVAIGHSTTLDRHRGRRPLHAARRAHRARRRARRARSRLRAGGAAAR